MLESAKSSAVSDVFAALGTIEEHECSSKVWDTLCDAIDTLEDAEYS